MLVDLFPDVWGDGLDGLFARVALTFAVTVLIMIGHP
jgi:hypothetical protein